MNIQIDPSAGYCFGVAKAIKHAEGNLEHGKGLLCLGEIVHNREENNRLEGMGLQIIDKDAFGKLRDTKVLIRAHGEPPETYETARKNNIELVEATCPVVLKLQQRVRAAWEEVKPLGGKVLIAGKKDHPEVVSLAGQAENNVTILESAEDLTSVDLTGPVRLFAQTTFNRDEYEKIRERIESAVKDKAAEKEDFKSFNSICGQVSNRIPKLTSFCRKHDIIIFVSGKNSSNGKNLYQICREENPSSYHISNPGEIDPAWIKDAHSVGISGATSTPLWLMEEVANKIAQY